MTSSNGSIRLTSSGSKRSREAMLASARRRRSRAKSAFASALGRPLSGMGQARIAYRLFCTKLVEMIEISPFRVVVVGGGFAGTVTTVALLRTGRPLSDHARRALGRLRSRCRVLDHRSRYLLNVCAGNMSALDDEPATSSGGAERSRASTSRGRATATICRRCWSATTTAASGACAARRSRSTAAQVVLRGGERLEADAVVLATGISPPAAVRGPIGHPAYVADPWDRDAVAALADRARC